LAHLHGGPPSSALYGIPSEPQSSPTRSKDAKCSMYRSGLADDRRRMYVSGNECMKQFCICSFTRRDRDVPRCHLFTSHARSGPIRYPISFTCTTHKTDRRCITITCYFEER